MKVKICCIKNIEEAEMAIRHGANVLGLVGNMPSGPGVIDDETIAEIVKTIPNHIETFLLTSETDAQAIIEHHQKVNTSAIQIVDELKTGTYSDIRQVIPNVKIVQVLHVIDQSIIAKAKSIENEVGYILLDSGNPNLEIKELGGTGRTHNWEISKQLIRSVAVPVFLAGGLRASNVQQAMQQVQPYGIDLCSGVRENDELDEEKLKYFFDKINHLHSF